MDNDKLGIRTDEKQRTFITLNGEMIGQAQYVSFKADADKFNQTVIHMAASDVVMELKSNNIQIVQATEESMTRLKTIRDYFQSENVMMVNNMETVNLSEGIKLLDELIEEMK